MTATVARRPAPVPGAVKPPADAVAFVNPSEVVGGVVRPGETVRLTVSAEDEESDIDPDQPIVFFLGEPPSPDGKPVQGTIAVKEIVRGTTPTTAPADGLTAGVIPGEKRLGETRCTRPSSPYPGTRQGAGPEGRDPVRE